MVHLSSLDKITLKNKMCKTFFCNIFFGSSIAFCIVIGSSLNTLDLISFVYTVLHCWAALIDHFGRIMIPSANNPILLHYCIFMLFLYEDNR